MKELEDKYKLTFEVKNQMEYSNLITKLGNDYGEFLYYSVIVFDDDSSSTFICVRKDEFDYYIKILKNNRKI